MPRPSQPEGREGKTPERLPLPATAWRQVFDDLSINTVSFLESHPCAASVVFSERPSVTLAQLQAWESQNQPHVLPEDYKALLAVSNGVRLSWSLRFRGEVEPFGMVHVNRLEQVKRLPPAALQRFPRSADAAPQPGTAVASEPVAAFDLDAECAHGRVALVLCNSSSSGSKASDRACGWTEARARGPQVWFQDLSCQWYLLANSFTDYFRLVALHLGVPQWHYAFTDVGLAPAAQHWLALFCPERFALAVEHRSALSCNGRAGSAGGHTALAAGSEPPRAAGPVRQRRRRKERSSSARRPGCSTGAVLGAA